MHELSRLAYLEAIGIDSYISRQQLAGAAASRRLRIRHREVPTPEAPELPVEALKAPVQPLPKAESAKRPAARPTPKREAPAPIERFSLAALVAGSYLWLEDLDGQPLASEQVHLVQAMSLAISGKADKADVAQFDWPLHSNRQLDLSEEAARAALGGFLGRRLEQFGCAGIILLGSTVNQRLDALQLPVKLVRCDHGSAQMLAKPSLKREVWRVLAPLRQP